MHTPVEALAFMCRLCFSPSLQNRTVDTDDPQFYLEMHAADQRLAESTRPFLVRKV